LLSTVRFLLNPEIITGPWSVGLPSAMAIYENPYGNFTMLYPENWNAYNTPDGNHGDTDMIGMIIVPGRTYPRVYIATNNGVNLLEEVVDWGEERIHDSLGYQEISLESVDMNNLEGIRRNYIKQSGSEWFGYNQIICQAYYILDHSTGFTFTFCSESDKWEGQVNDVFQRMIESIRIEN